MEQNNRVKEYEIRCYKDYNEAEKELNKFSEGGWELEQVIVEGFLFANSIVHYYSRPKKE